MEFAENEENQALTANPTQCFRIHALKGFSMPRQIVFTPKAAKPPPAYSQAVKAAGLVFVSGTAPNITSP